MKSSKEAENVQFCKFFFAGTADSASACTVTTSLVSCAPKNVWKPAGKCCPTATTPSRSSDFWAKHRKKRSVGPKNPQHNYRTTKKPTIATTITITMTNHHPKIINSSNNFNFNNLDYSLDRLFIDLYKNCIISTKN